MDTYRLSTLEVYSNDDTKMVGFKLGFIYLDGSMEYIEVGQQTSTSTDSLTDLHVEPIVGFGGYFDPTTKLMKTFLLCHESDEYPRKVGVADTTGTDILCDSNPHFPNYGLSIDKAIKGFYVQHPDSYTQLSDVDQILGMRVYNRPDYCASSTLIPDVTPSSIADIVIDIDDSSTHTR